MDFKKSMCDRLGYKYQDIFNHLEYILNKMNSLLNNYGCSLNEKELEMLNDLFFKLQTGKIEIIEFTRPIEKYLDVDKIFKENKELKEENHELKLCNSDYYNQLNTLSSKLSLINIYINEYKNCVPKHISDYINKVLFDNNIKLGVDKE